MADLRAMNDLFNRCYRATRPLAEAEWLYARNPYGEAIVFAAFDADGELVAMRPAAAHKFWWRGQERQAYQFVDAVVAPEHRNQGLFRRLITAISEAADKGEFSLFSFPNHNSLPIYRKTASLDCLGRCQVQVRILSLVDYARYKLGHPRSLPPPRSPSAGAADPGIGDGRIWLAPARCFESDYAEIHEEVSAVAASFTLRRRDFLNWRYFGSPERQYHVATITESGRDAGYVVLRLINRIAHVVDLFVRPQPSVIRTVIGLVSQWARQLDAIAVYFDTSHGNWFQRAVSDAGGVFTKATVHIVLDRATLSRLSILEGRPVSSADFYFVMGDGDFF